MAKKITDNESNAVRPHVLPAETTGQPATTETPESDEKMPAPVLEKKPTEEKPSQEIPLHAERILKTYSNYQELYIDFQGGAFTVDTPPAFRSNATLYTNPYYTKP